MLSFEDMAQSLDMLINSDMVGRGISTCLYPKARSIYGKPLTFLAAQKIKDAVDPGDLVIIMTGFRTPPLFIQETDGPLGAASLARSVDVALAGKVILLTEPDAKSIKILEASCMGAGLSIVPLQYLLEQEVSHAVAVTSFTTDEKKAREEAIKLLDTTKAKAVVAIEKAGRNNKHIYHNQGGFDISKYHSKVECIFEEANRRGIPTIGVGDGGNEVGMGVLEQVVIRNVDYGGKCNCFCGGGIAASMGADVLVTANVSNWGAYAIAGLLSRMTNKEEGLHSRENEENMFLLSMAEGAIDGDKGTIEKSCDNMGINIHQAVLTLIRQILFHNDHPVISGKTISV